MPARRRPTEQPRSATRPDPWKPDGRPNRPCPPPPPHRRGATLRQMARIPRTRMPAPARAAGSRAFPALPAAVLSNRVSSTIARDYGERFALSVTEWRVMAVLALPGPVGQRGGRAHGDGQGRGQPRGGAPAGGGPAGTRAPRRRPPALGAAAVRGRLPVYDQVACWRGVRTPRAGRHGAGRARRAVPPARPPGRTRDPRRGRRPASGRRPPRPGRRHADTS